jgi:hypothetical protein
MEKILWVSGAGYFLPLTEYLLEMDWILFIHVYVALRKKMALLLTMDSKKSCINKLLCVASGNLEQLLLIDNMDGTPLCLKVTEGRPNKGR